MTNYRHYLVYYHYTRPKGDPEYLALLEAIEPDIIWHVLDETCCSTVMMQSQLTAWDFGKTLTPYFHPNDELLIIEVRSNNAWYGLNNEDRARLYLGSPSLPAPPALPSSPGG